MKNSTPGRVKLTSLFTCLHLSPLFVNLFQGMALKGGCVKFAPRVGFIFQYYNIIISLDKKIFEHKIVNIFLSINLTVLTFVVGAQKNHLIEIAILSTHNICFG